MNFADVDLLAVLLTAVLLMVLGTVWYGPIFGKQWMKLVGLTKADMEKAMKKGMGKTYLAAFFTSSIMAAVFQMFLMNFGLLETKSAMLFGFWIWLGFFATTALGSVLWEGKKFQLYLINASYSFFAMMLMALVLSSWS